MAGRAKKRNNEQAPFSRDVNAVTAFTGTPAAPAYFNSERTEVWEGVWSSLAETGGAIIQNLYGAECHVNAIVLMRDMIRDKKSKPTAVAAAIEYVRRTAVDLGLTMATFTRMRAPKLKKQDSEGIADLLRTDAAA